MRVLALLDGTQADPDSPLIRVDDLGLMRGDGVFETILVVDGKPRELGPHLDRLARSAALLDLPDPDRAGFERAVDVVLANWSGGREIALKLVMTRGVEGGDGTPTAFALGMDIGPKVHAQRAEGLAAVTLDRGIEPGLMERAPWLLLSAKSLSYAVNMAALREAERRGASEVVFTTSSGSVLEGPTSTVVVARGKTLTTPPHSLGLLPGTTQAALFRAAARAGWTVEVEPVAVDDLYDADAVVLASSVRKLTRVHTLDGKALPDSAGVHAELVELYESEY
ncbi:aminodeoxychorismate lyase [Saccharothrix mutabilis subsp. mutabilis]|uniref:Aminodeoxychorismate lyase n=1 Tax=Saccharothrix mutabilis subsp. mutabilis TaxID=66855 RepID=A0ABP3DA83_9PSEU